MEMPFHKLNKAAEMELILRAPKYLKKWIGFVICMGCDSNGIAKITHKDLLKISGDKSVSSLKDTRNKRDFDVLGDLCQIGLLDAQVKVAYYRYNPSVINNKSKEMQNFAKSQWTGVDIGEISDEAYRLSGYNRKQFEEDVKQRKLEAEDYQRYIDFEPRNKTLNELKRKQKASNRVHKAEMKAIKKSHKAEIKEIEVNFNDKFNALSKKMDDDRKAGEDRLQAYIDHELSLINDEIHRKEMLERFQVFSNPKAVTTAPIGKLVAK